MNLLAGALELVVDIITLLPVIAILFLLFRLLRPNPFDRILFRREYVLSGGAFPHWYQITFTKHAKIHSLRKAVYDVMFNHPDTKCMIFSNLSPYNFPADTFFPFTFSCLDFSGVDYIPNRYVNLETISGALPCSTLILPQNMDHFWFHSYCHDLRRLVIPSFKLVKAFFSPTCASEGERTILVQQDFEISVPEEMLVAYKSDPNWASLRFEDDAGNIFPPNFTVYHP